MNVTTISWCLPDIEEPHQINVLTMDVSINLDWRSDLLDHDRLSSHDVSALSGQFDDVLSLAWELTSRLDVLALLGLEQRLQEHADKGLIRVLIDLGVVLVLGVQLLWLLGELVDGDLSNDQGKVLGLLVLLLVGRGGDMSLVGKDKLSIHIVETLLILLDSFLLLFLTFLSLGFRRFDLLEKIVVFDEKLSSINLTNL